MKRQLALLVLCLPFLVGAAGAPPRFNAVLQTGNDWRFILIAPDGCVSSWLQIGQTFHDFRVHAYDAQAQTLEIEHDGARARVRLDPDAPPMAPPALPAGALDETAARLAERMRFERFIDKAVAEARNVQITHAERLVAEVNRTAVEKQDADAMRRKIAAEVTEVFHDPDIRLEIERSYRAVFSEPELRALAEIHGVSHFQMPAAARADPFLPDGSLQRREFDQSPLGRKWLAAQPELRSRIDSSIASRIKLTLEKFRRLSLEPTARL